jgi:myo-inositol catabolism protein IolC
MMRRGYTLPLCLLPFDHRHSYVTGMFHFTPPLTSDQHEAVVESKEVIYDGFQHALGRAVPVAYAGIMVDEEFGAGILRDAVNSGFVTALSTEQSSSNEFDFEHGAAFAEHIEAFEPTFAKALVRYNPEGDATLNERQATRLKRLSDYCQTVDQRFMLELLVPATDAQRSHIGADETTYDLRMRPGLTVAAMAALQDAGVEPDVWKIEGLDRREDCERVVATARRDGRDQVSCIVLGRGANPSKVVRWLETAASVEGFIGFAVGRTTFWDPIAAFVANKGTRREAVSRIAHRFREWAGIFERAHAVHENAV